MEIQTPGISRLQFPVPKGEDAESHMFYGSIQAPPSFTSANVVNGASELRIIPGPRHMGDDYRRRVLLNYAKLGGNRL